MKRLRWCALVLGSVVLLTACLPDAPGGKAPAPVSTTPMADPFVIRAGGRYYAFVSNYFFPTRNVPWLVSTDPMHSWSQQGDALPQLGTWAVPGNTWAPGVLKRGDHF